MYRIERDSLRVGRVLWNAIFRTQCLNAMFGTHCSERIVRNTMFDARQWLNFEPVFKGESQ